MGSYWADITNAADDIMSFSTDADQKIDAGKFPDAKQQNKNIRAQAARIKGFAATLKKVCVCDDVPALVGAKKKKAGAKNKT